MSLSGRSADNILSKASQVFVWKITWQYFYISERSKDQSSISLKDQLTIIWLGLIKHLSERSVDNTSVKKNISFFLSADQIIQKVFLFPRIFNQLFRIANYLFIKQLIAYHTVMTIFKCINCKKPGYIYWWSCIL